jgi:hypothetical protein
VEPIGPDWPSLSLRVPEQDVQRLPALLHAARPRAIAMGAAARAAWQEHFAPQVQFHRLAQSIERLMRTAPPGYGWPLRWPLLRARRRLYSFGRETLKQTALRTRKLAGR